MPSYTSFDANGLLCGYTGGDIVFAWTYSRFEEYMNECITPSMYHFMSIYVKQNLTCDDLEAIERREYSKCNLEADAVDAYFDVPLNERITMHEQELVNLRSDKRRAEAKESAAIDAMLEENKPFGDSSPIAHEYAEFMRGIIAENRVKIERIENDIYTEEQWRGGHESSDLETDECYDSIDE